MAVKLVLDEALVVLLHSYHAASKKKNLLNKRKSMEIG
jgi:hypothetical protein